MPSRLHHPHSKKMARTPNRRAYSTAACSCLLNFYALVTVAAPAGVEVLKFWRGSRQLLSVERPDGRSDSALALAAKIATARNPDRSKGRSERAVAQILDPLVPTTVAASSVSCTQHIHLGLNNSCLHLSKHGLAFFQRQTNFFRSNSTYRPLNSGNQLSFKDAVVEARFDTDPKLHRSLSSRFNPRGKRLPESTTDVVPPPTLIQFRDSRPFP